MTRGEFISGLVRIGEQVRTGEDEAEVDAYFAPDYVFHGPERREWDDQALKAHFSPMTVARWIDPAGAHVRQEPPNGFA